LDNSGDNDSVAPFELTFLLDIGNNQLFNIISESEMLLKNKAL